MVMTTDGGYREDCVEDDAWQRKMRDKILVPHFYERKAKGRYRLLDHDMNAQKRDIDTIANFGRGQRTISEKIVRHPTDKETKMPKSQPHTSFALETENDGKPSGMSITEAQRLLYCFANYEETLLKCYYIDMQELKAWFEKNAHRYYEWIDPKPDYAHCRLVRIDDVLQAVTARVFIIPQA